MSKMAMSSVGSIFASIQKTVKTSSGSAVNIVICLVTVGSEQLFSFAAFRCPCPDNKKNSSTTKMGLQQNFIYGWVFIIVPAFALFVLGYGMHTKTWKLITGCCKRSEKASRGFAAGLSTLLEIFVQALVAPITWMSVAFLDGKYYACASSVNPYKATCEQVNRIKSASAIPVSIEFESKKQTSQIVGWILVASALFCGSIFYMVYRCLSPLTYHHRKYARWYREMETKAFEEKAKLQIKNEVENETVARFLLSKRPKSDWDKISTVFNFTRDDKDYALYSRLDEWNEKNKSNNPLPSEIDKAAEVTEDISSLDLAKNNSHNNNTPSASHDPALVTPLIEHASDYLGRSTKKSARPTSTNAQDIPKLPPPPQSSGKRRYSVTSQDSVPAPRPNGSVQSPGSLSDQQMQPTRGLMPNDKDDDVTEESELLRQKVPKSKSMGDIEMQAKSTVQESSSAPFYDDTEESKLL